MLPLSTEKCKLPRGHNDQLPLAMSAARVKCEAAPPRSLQALLLGYLSGWQPVHVVKEPGWELCADFKVGQLRNLELCESQLPHGSVHAVRQL